MAYESSPIGHERTVVMFGVPSKILNTPSFLQSCVRLALEEDKFTILDITSHEFSPQGFALVALLAESHAALHTYPEFGSLVFNLYSCRSEDDGKEVIKYLVEKFKPTSFTEQDNPVRVKKAI